MLCHVARLSLLAIMLCAGGLGPLCAADARPPRAVRLNHAALVGRYRMMGQHDIVSELELLSDGRFRFGLAGGALDLTAQGRWTSDGRSVILNSEPRPVPPAFSAGPVGHTDRAPLVIMVQNPAGRGLALVDLALGFADGHSVIGYTNDDGWELTEGGEPAAARWVELSLRMFGLPPHRFPLDPAAGNEFTFIMTPNDLGVQDFHDTVLPITREGLVLHLLGGTATYVREGRQR